MIKLARGDFGMFVVENENGETMLIQSDWDYPGIASAFGWVPCHRSTDGTVDCPECGTSASILIGEAYDFLSDSVGETAEDPGYFN